MAVTGLALLMGGTTWAEPAGGVVPELPPAALEGREREAGGAAETAPAETNGVPALRLALGEAVFRALERNAAFQVERLNPAVERTGERTERAAFDPVFTASVSRRESPDDADGLAEGDRVGTLASLREFLPSGTTLGLALEQGAASSTTPRSTGYDARITQSLLRGAGTGVNLARLRQAQLSTLESSYELRGVAETLIAQVERAFWDYVLAERSIAIYEKSLEIAEQQIVEARERIRVGKLAETELTAVEAELARRRESLIDVRSGLARSRLTLLRLINPAVPEPFETALAVEEPPLEEPGPLEHVRAHVAVGMRQRADLNQARLAVERGELEVVRTRNGVLPKLDLFIRLGGTRYAESFAAQEEGEWSQEVEVGLLLEYPIGGRSERAARDRAMLSLEQERGALYNMAQLVEVDVRTAHLEVERAQEQVKATEATRRLREETARVEAEKLKVGKSTALFVAQASRDYVESEIGCVRAQVALRKAMLELYRLEGSLLERRGITAGD